MNTQIVDRDLTKSAPHSPRNRIGGFVIASRAVDKCRATAMGHGGEYHYNCPLDKLLFEFKGITGDQFASAVQSATTYEEVGTWLQEHGKVKSAPEIKAWSDEMEISNPMQNPDRRVFFVENCTKLGLNPETSSIFDWLEADDLAEFSPQHVKTIQQTPNPKSVPPLMKGMSLAESQVIDAPRMYKTENDLNIDQRASVTVLLNQRLSSAIDLQMQLKQAHWNVKGPNFIGLHELFDQVDEAVETYVDQIAERIVQLGGVAAGTVRVAAARSQLDEYPYEISDGPAHVCAVAHALATFGHEVRVTIGEATVLGDDATADLCTEITRGLNKWLWFVEAHAQSVK